MKAEDLMIGDWVLVKELDFSNLTNVISEYQHQIRLKDFAEMYNAGEYKKYEPIPLTPEILEKNGFGFIDTYNGEFNSVWTGWWILDGLELGCCDNSKFPVFFNIADTNVKVNYAHELQHALKLCKIKKEIVL